MHIKIFTGIGKCVAFLMWAAFPSSLARADMFPLKSEHSSDSYCREQFS